MTWRVLFASQMGTSHTGSGVPCQDDCWASVEKVAGSALLTIFVADGAGSASRGDDGAQTAVREAIAYVSSNAHDDFQGLFTERFGRNLVRAVREALTAQSQRTGIRIREYACTFLAVLSSEEHGTLAVQIGDGAMVIDVGDGLVVPIEPMAGEYANATRFVTEDDADEVVEVRHFDRAVARAAAFTDGLEPLALNQSDNTAHSAFFTPFFSALSTATTEDEANLQDELTGALLRFLTSEAVNARTDDDKTLVVAVQTNTNDAGRRVDEIDDHPGRESQEPHSWAQVRAEVREPERVVPGSDPMEASTEATT